MQLVVLANGPPDPFGNFVMTRGKTSPPLDMLMMIPMAEAEVKLCYEV